MAYCLKTLCQTCKFFRLRPMEYDKPHVAALLWEIKEEQDNTEEEIGEYLNDLIGGKEGTISLFQSRFFYPWCVKLDHLCVCVESVAIGGGATPLALIFSHFDRLVACSDWERDTAPLKFLFQFMLDYIEM